MESKAILRELFGLICLAIAMVGMVIFIVFMYSLFDQRKVEQEIIHNDYAQIKGD